MKRFLPLLGGLLFLSVLQLFSLLLPGMLFIYNYTDSMPHGIYFLHKGTVKKGDLVVFEPPAEAARLIRERKYLREGAFLMKHVAGMKGDRVSTENGFLMVNGENFGPFVPSDREGRQLPRYTFNGELKAGYIMAVKGRENSFDSRCFGPVPERYIIGQAKPVLLFDERFLWW